MGAGSTVVLSECNSGRGEIRAESVVGLARGFLFACAAATVVALWSVDDVSTATLMEQMYKHLEDGRTTAQALRLAILHLLHGRSESWQNSRWRRPLYWAAFLVMGANTRLPGVSVRVDTLEGPAEETVTNRLRKEEEDLRRIVGHEAYTEAHESQIEEGDGW